MLSSSVPSTGDIPPAPLDGMFHLRIKSFKDVEIAVPAGSVVGHVKQQVKAALNNEEDCYLRLICKGRLLFPDDHPISDFNVQNGDVVHAVVAPKKQPEPAAAQSGESSRRRRTRRRHAGTIVGPGGRVTRAPLDNPFEEEESSEEESSEDDAQEGVVDIERPAHQRRRVRERRGFDRLRQPDNGIIPTALSRAEVTVIRAYFSRQVDRHVQQYSTNPTPQWAQIMQESDPIRRRWLQEEDWMAQQGPTSEFRLNLNQNTLLRLAALQQSQAPFLRNSPNNNIYGSISVGTDRDFMWGFMLGFFVGFVMLVWVWMPTVPHKQKIGILTGISFQLAMNVYAPVPLEGEGSSEDFLED